MKSISSRFKIYVKITKKSRYYFFPQSYWESVNFDSNGKVEVGMYSGIQHGFLTTSYPTTKSLFYDSPFFFSFKTSHKLIPNYLSFKSNNRPNIENNILAMVIYDENLNNLQPFYNPIIQLHHLKLLPANTTFEFSFFDSQKKPIQIADNSQLYVKMVLE
jgi:hypothetical protein